MLILAAETKLGRAPAPAAEALTAIDLVERLECRMSHLYTAKSWNELLANGNSVPPFCNTVVKGRFGKTSAKPTLQGRVCPIDAISSATAARTGPRSKSAPIASSSSCSNSGSRPNNARVKRG